MDRRIAKTRISLVASLRLLMMERAWDDISVQLICDKADISRSTFYGHFTNKQELLDLSLEGLKIELSEGDSSRGLDKHGNFQFLPMLLNHLKGHLKIFEQHRSSPSGIAILGRVRRIAQNFVELEVGNSKYAKRLSRDDIIFLCGGMSAIIESWVYDDCRPLETAVLNSLDHLVDKVLTAD